MPPARQDVRLLVFAIGSVVLAGVVVAAVLLVATSRGSTPKGYRPFEAGVASSIKGQLRDGGPFFFPDPFGGNRSILFALENGNVVALSNILPGTKSCTVKWRGSLNRFVDCHGDRLRSVDLDRYTVSIGQSGSDKGLLLVDLRHEEPAPSSVTTTTAAAG
jgi:hypothetical protein